MEKYRKRYYVALAAAALSVTLAAGCASDRLEKQAAARQTGIESMQRGAYQEAIAAFDSALSSSGGTIGEREIDICYYKAAAQYSSGDVEGALATYNAMIDYDKDNANAYYLRGCLRLQKGEASAAQEDFESAVARNAKDYALYIHIYENLSAHNLQAEGEEYLKKAFSIKGGDAADLSWRGKIYFLLGEYENAKTELAASLDKGGVEANLTLAQVYEAQGDSATAETYYKAYLDAGTADSEAMNALAEIEMAKLNYPAALSYIEQGLAMEAVPNRRELMQNQMICMEYTADFAGAWGVIQEYIALYPEDMDAQREYIFLKNRQGVLSDAEAVCGEIVDNAGQIPQDTQAAE